MLRKELHKLFCFHFHFNRNQSSSETNARNSGFGNPASSFAVFRHFDCGDQQAAKWTLGNRLSNID